MERPLLLTIFMLVMSALFFWAGYLTPPPRPYQYRLRSAFYIFLALACFSGYFALREAHTIGELAELIEPVADITDVTYIPTSAEVAAISKFMAVAPSGRRMRTTREERRKLSDEADTRSSEYWLISTALAPDQVFAFYRKTADLRGWTIVQDNPPWLRLVRDSMTLALYVTDDRPGSGARVLYSFTPGIEDTDNS